MRYNAQQRAYSQALRSSEMAEARATLAPAAETNRATRKKIIDLAMRLDASTVSRRAV